MASYAYTAYGELMPNSPEPKVFGYNAEATDYTTGLQYLRARYYDTGISRFVQEDDYKGKVTRPASMNRYIYTEGNPVRGIDPSGYDTLDDYLYKLMQNTYQAEREWMAMDDVYYADKSAENQQNQYNAFINYKNVFETEINAWETILEEIYDNFSNASDEGAKKVLSEKGNELKLMYSNRFDKYSKSFKDLEYKLQDFDFNMTTVIPTPTVVPAVTETASGEGGQTEAKCTSIDDSSEDDTIQKVLELARNQIGNKHNKYTDWYTKKRGEDYSKENWCAIFIAWCAYQENIMKRSLNTSVASNYIAGRSGTGDLKIEYFKADRYISLQKHVDFVPKPGDLVLFESPAKSPCHVGFVNKVATYTKEDGTKQYRIFTIEGNSSNQDGGYMQVAEHWYDLDGSDSSKSTWKDYDKDILGFCLNRPTDEKLPQP